MPIMCEECKCSNWICSDCGDSNHHDCDCTCCGCECQRQDSTALAVHIDNQPTERSNTMETTVQPFEAEAFNKEIGDLKQRIEALTIDLSTQRSFVDEHRRKVSRLFTKLNDYIEEGDYDEDGDINLSELDDILSGIFSNRLVFEKVYEVQITYTLDATFEIRAKDEDAAREIAEEIGISTDPVFDHDEDPTECVIDQSRVGYLQRKVN